MSDQMCTDCDPQDGSRLLNRRAIIRKYGLRGVAMVAGVALAAKTNDALAGYVFMGWVDRNCYCANTCYQICDHCRMWRNEFGQVYYDSCSPYKYQRNCCRAFGKPCSCCGNPTAVC